LTSTCQAMLRAAFLLFLQPSTRERSHIRVSVFNTRTRSSIKFAQVYNGTVENSSINLLLPLVGIDCLQGPRLAGEI